MKRIAFFALLASLLAACTQALVAPTATATSVPPTSTTVPTATVTTTPTTTPTATPVPAFTIDMGSILKVAHVVKGQPVFVEYGWGFTYQDSRDYFVAHSTVYVEIDGADPIVVADPGLWELKNNPENPPGFEFTCEWIWKVPDLEVGSHTLTATFYYLTHQTAKKEVTIIVDP